jgi:DNA polymerase-3 subunit gamma/tau
VVEDLLALTHELTRDKLAPEAAAPERAELAAKLGLPVLARAWQVLLKGLDEVGQAPDGAAAAEMLLVRLACMGDLPPPAELLRKLEGGGPVAHGSAAAGAAQAPRGAPAGTRGAAPAASPAPSPTAEPASLPPMPRDLDGIVKLLSEGGHPRLAALVRTSARPATIEPGRLRLAWTAGTPGETGRELAQALHALTGRRWGVDAAPSDAPTLAERDEARLRARMEEARHWPQVRAVLDKIPGATIVGVEMRTDDDAPVSPPRQEGSLSG